MATVKKNTVLFVFLLFIIRCYSQNSSDYNEQYSNLNSTKIQNTTTSENSTIRERKKVVINVCCADTNIWDGSGCSRYKLGNITRPEIKSPLGKDWVYERYRPCKDLNHLLLIPGTNEISVFRNGKISLRNSGNNGSSKMWNSDEYCIANYLDKGKVLLSFLACIPDDYDIIIQFLGLLTALVTVLSIPFATVTYFIYAFISELRNLRGFILMAYIACIYINKLYFAALLFADNGITLSWNNFCINFEFFQRFFQLAEYCWSSVICFDIWQTFRCLRLLALEERKRIKLLFYSLYGWGIPAVIIGFNLNFKNNNDSCSYENSEEMYGPVGLVIIITTFVNLYFFLRTAINIYKQKKSITNETTGTDSQRHDENKHWFNLYMKLFMLMGVNISISLIFDWLPKFMPLIIHHIAVQLLDLLQTVQLFIIFFILICNKRVKKLIRKKIGKEKKSSQMTVTSSKKSSVELHNEKTSVSEVGQFECTKL